MNSPHSDPAPSGKRSRGPLLWASLLLVLAVVLAGIDYIAQLNSLPRGLHLALLLAPPVLALFGSIPLLWLGGKWLLAPATGRSDPAIPERPRGLFMQALRVGSPRWSVTAGIACIVSFELGRIEGMPPIARAVFAVLPLVPMFFLLRSLGWSRTSSDELVGLVHQKASEFAFYATMGIVACVFLLKQAGLITRFQWNALSLIGMMIGLRIVGALIASLRFR